VPNYYLQRLPESIVFLAFVFKETSSVASKASVRKCRFDILNREHFKLSLDE
jgi:hypothetical protein